MKKLIILTAFLTCALFAQSQVIVSKPIDFPIAENTFITLDSSYFEIVNIKTTFFNKYYKVVLSVGNINNGNLYELKRFKLRFKLAKSSNFLLNPIAKERAWLKTEFDLTDSDMETGYFYSVIIE